MAKLHVYQALDSTNDFLKENQNRFQHGDGIAAQNQSKGRGQKGNIWASEAGKNATFSVLWRWVNFRPEHQFQLSKLVALTCVNFIKKCLPQAKVAIKWPNDILVNRKKIAGLLIESNIQGKQLKSSVVGIGLNVNQTIFPDAFCATSLRQLGAKQKVDTCVKTLYDMLNSDIDSGLLDNNKYLNKRYLDCLFGLNQKLFNQMLFFKPNCYHFIL